MIFIKKTNHKQSVHLHMNEIQEVQDITNQVYKALNRCGIIFFVLVQDKLLGVDRQTKEGTLNQTGGFVKHSTHAHTLIDLTDVNDSLLMLIVVVNLLFWFKREVSAKWGNISIDKSHCSKFSASTSLIYFARSCRNRTSYLFER